MVAQGKCPVCGAPARSDQVVGDTRVIECPQCGGYRLTATLDKMITAGSLHLPSPSVFRALVKNKRRDLADFPVIHWYDLGT